jgi:hypothetical protein
MNNVDGLLVLYGCLGLIFAAWYLLARRKRRTYFTHGRGW